MFANSAVINARSSKSLVVLREERVRVMQLSVITAPNVAYGEQLGEMALKRCILNVLIMRMRKNP